MLKKILQADGRNKAKYKNRKVNLQLLRKLQKDSIMQYYLAKREKKDNRSMDLLYSL